MFSVGQCLADGQLVWVEKVWGRESWSQKRVLVVGLETTLTSSDDMARSH